MKKALAFILAAALIALCPASLSAKAAAATPAPLGIEKQPLTFEELAPTTTMSFEELAGDNGVYEDETQVPPPPSEILLVSPSTSRLSISLTGSTSVAP